MIVAGRLGALELQAVMRVPEETVKRALAGLIGENFVPKDWGGEQSDLYTSRVFARGRFGCLRQELRALTAWLLLYRREGATRACGL